MPFRAALTTPKRGQRPSSPGEQPETDVNIHEHRALTAWPDVSIHEQVTSDLQHSAKYNIFRARAADVTRPIRAGSADCAEVRA